ncbi:MAG: hypothetical protein ACAH83_03085 [Alphaproteobacteria bacterium]
MSSCSSCSSAYATAQSYVRDQLNNFQKPPQQDAQVSNDVDSSPALNSSGRGQLLNVSA